MLLSLLADILAMDALIRLWANPLPGLWWQVLVMFLGDIVLSVLFRRSVRLTGRKSRSSKNYRLLTLCNRLGLIVIGLATLLPD